MPKVGHRPASSPCSLGQVGRVAPSTVRRPLDRHDPPAGFPIYAPPASADSLPTSSFTLGPMVELIAAFSR